MTDRFKVIEEKKPKQFAIVDTLTNDTIVRYALKSKAELICADMNEKSL